MAKMKWAYDHESGLLIKNVGFRRESELSSRIRSSSMNLCYIFHHKCGLPIINMGFRRESEPPSRIWTLSTNLD